MFVDIVLPNGNEEAFVKRAVSLNFDGLCFLYSPKDFLTSRPLLENLSSKYNLKLYSGLLVDKDFLSFKRKFKPDLICSYSLDRAKIHRGLDVMFRAEDSSKDFLRFRNSGLDLVKSSIMRRFDVLYGFDISFVVDSIANEDYAVLSRIVQNFKILRKSKLDMVFASFSSDPCKLFNVDDVRAFMISFGASTQQVALASKLLADRITFNSDFNKGLIVEKGVRRLSDEELRDYIKRSN